MTEMLSFPPAHGRGVKWAFTTRRVNRADAVALLPDVAAARPGNLLLAEVVEIGQHGRVQLAEGRLSALYPGDRVVLAVGDRYAPDQFEAFGEISPEGCDLIAGGGIAGRWVVRHAKMDLPTRLRPLGLLGAAGGRAIDVAEYALGPLPRPAMPVIGVTGASMNSGKTTATAALSHGLTRAGLRVAAIKATGTGAFGDYHTFEDSGAFFVADFTDAGMATTYRQPLSRIMAGLDTLLGHAALRGCEVAVVELADGVFQQETRAILADPALRAVFDGFMLAAGDALATVGGVRVLDAYGISPVAVSGLVSLSPLAVREAEAATGVRILAREALNEPGVARGLLGAVRPEGACLLREGA